MFNDLHACADIDYAAYLVRVGCDTLEDALDDVDPRTNSDSDKPDCFAGPAQSTDYFVFYQENGRWAWRRVNQAETGVEDSNGSFRFYLHCIADAKQHGWKGRPVSLFSECGFSRAQDQMGSELKFFPRARVSSSLPKGTRTLISSPCFVN